jgi:Asp-tRNA(Asn)/Glu-tRNA(Gln) amidotransferase C subunit
VSLPQRQDIEWIIRLAARDVESSEWPALAQQIAKIMESFWRIESVDSGGRTRV